MKLLFAFLLLWTTSAIACPGDAGEALPPPDQLAALERELARLAPECGNHAGYLAYRGAVLNALGRPAEAALLLEHALLLDPRRAGAQIDYAQALAALGDSASAQALLSDVLARPDVPPALRPRLERQLAAFDVLRRFDPLAALTAVREWAGSGWHGAGSVTVKLGRDSNLNSAPAHETLALTLPDGDAVLLLADRFRPRAGSAALVEASGQAIKPLAGGAALQFFGEARLREGQAEDTNFRQLQAGGALSQPLDTGFALFSASASHLSFGGEALFRATRAAISRDWQAGRCRPHLGLETERRNYPIAPGLDGRFVGLSGGASCGLDGGDRLVFRVRGGQDAALAGRPGGNQRQSDVRLVWTRALGGGRLGADLLWYHQQDASGYSPLLENGASRRINRVSLYLEYAYPVAPGWSVLASLENLAQRSNLALFDINGRAVYLGVRWAK